MGAQPQTQVCGLHLLPRYPCLLRRLANRGGGQGGSGELFKRFTSLYPLQLVY
jgi:hypothetical protein